ncbi:hypothetical protein K505DRAFT_422334 [Melanomma pulvis-pyrius CBS 109.77]|uniref:Uncharacterized protein n=1 Tax=Melanomma pulvis-pyrius CBS 109.77 TaxID=1314802 RepID=A0A6A6WRK8_9PLEO|nr:hypothetical protein K505DRAFT_422334 [Melanomma pulvis-pyrius CBS 109.77]
MARLGFSLCVRCCVLCSTSLPQYDFASALSNVYLQSTGAFARTVNVDITLHVSLKRWMYCAPSQCPAQVLLSFIQAATDANPPTPNQSKAHTSSIRLIPAPITGTPPSNPSPTSPPPRRHHQPHRTTQTPTRPRLTQAPAPNTICSSTTASISDPRSAFGQRGTRLRSFASGLRRGGWQRGPPRVKKLGVKHGARSAKGGGGGGGGAADSLAHSPTRGEEGRAVVRSGAFGLEHWVFGLVVSVSPGVWGGSRRRMVCRRRLQSDYAPPSHTPPSSVLHPPSSVIRPPWPDLNSLPHPPAQPGIPPSLSRLSGGREGGREDWVGLGWASVCYFSDGMFGPWCSRGWGIWHGRRRRRTRRGL